MAKPKEVINDELKSGSAAEGGGQDANKAKESQSPVSSCHSSFASQLVSQFGQVRQVPASFPWTVHLESASAVSYLPVRDLEVFSSLFVRQVQAFTLKLASGLRTFFAGCLVRQVTSQADLEGTIMPVVAVVRGGSLGKGGVWAVCNKPIAGAEASEHVLCNIKNAEAGLKPVGFMVDPDSVKVGPDTLVQFLRAQPTFIAHKQTQDNFPGTPGL